MKLSAKVLRFVSEAASSLPDEKVREAWNARALTAGSELSSDHAGIALRALEAAERDLVERLGQVGSDADLQAELGTDLQFVRSVQADLRRHRASVRAAE